TETNHGDGELLVWGGCREALGALDALGHSTLGVLFGRSLYACGPLRIAAVAGQAAGPTWLDWAGGSGLEDAMVDEAGTSCAWVVQLLLFSSQADLCFFRARRCSLSAMFLRRIWIWKRSLRSRTV